MDLWVIFLTGLTVGGLTCLAVQGGLLASAIAAREEEDFQQGHSRKHNLFPVLAFLTTKLIAYSILGFILGAFGSALAISDSARIVMQIVAGLYMVIIALDLLNVHPIFRHFIIQPPKFLTRMVRNTAKSRDLFAPAVLGFFTIFIPCGTTLAMETFAISSGSPLLGAAIMGVFVLGTSPLFLGLGFITTILGDKFRTRFFKLAGALVMYLGITTLNGGLILAGSPINLATIKEAIPIEIDFSGGQVSANQEVNTIGGVQKVDISVFPNGYSPNYIKVKADSPVELNFSSIGGLGCTSQIRIPQLGVTRNLPLNGKTSIAFTPERAGKIIWTCSMGMYSGIIEVI